MVATFHLHYLGYMIKYGSLGVGNTAQQLLSILSISDSMNLIQLIDCWRADDEFSWKNFVLLWWKSSDMTKNIRCFLENLFEYYFLNIIVNVNFFIYLKFEILRVLPWNIATCK